MTPEQYLNMVLNRFQVAINYHETIKLLNDKCKGEPDQRKIIANIITLDILKKEFETLMNLGIKEYSVYMNPSNLIGVETSNENKSPS